MNWKQAFTLGLLAPGVWDGERVPVAYSYNGVVLPGLPEWDKNKHRYAVMCFYDHRFAVLNQNDAVVVYLLSEITMTNDLADSNGTYKDYIWLSDGDEKITATRPVDSTGAFSEYSEIESAEAGTKFALENVIWANVDLYATNGQLYLATYDPIPVYE